MRGKKRTLDQRSRVDHGVVYKFMPDVSLCTPIAEAIHFSDPGLITGVWCVVVSTQRPSLQIMKGKSNNQENISALLRLCCNE